MSLGQDIQSTVTQKINELGSNLIIKDYAVSYNSYGDALGTLVGTSNVTVVPINYIFPRNVYNNFGINEEGDLTLITKHDFSISGTGTMEYYGEEYMVQSVTPIPFQDLVMAKTIVLNRKSP